MKIKERDGSGTGEKLKALRREYAGEKLNSETVDPDPIVQFGEWFEQALSAELVDPNAMTLATATSGGIPSARIVLLKGFDEKGFRFYTNYESRKGKELEENPHAALCVYWRALSRQVRIEGRVEKLSREESEEYFQQRPRPSQIGAWASEQSSTVASREELDEQFRRLQDRFKGREIPLPDNWGGYLLKPGSIEFWQGREKRMHDRLLYRGKEGGWELIRLAP